MICATDIILGESLSAFHSSIFIGCRLSFGLVDEGMMSDMKNLRTLPVLPIKNTVLFPYIHLPFSVGRPLSLAALETAVGTRRKRDPDRQPARQRYRDAWQG